jgi:cytochrome P450
MTAATTSPRLRPGDLDLTDPDTFVEGPPHDYLRMLRLEDPVSWNPAPPASGATMPVTRGLWVLSRYHDVVHASRTPRLFSTFEGTAFVGDPTEEVLPQLRAQLINMDPPQHHKYRRLVQRGFTPRMVKNIEPTIREHARRIVDAVAPRGRCEFVTELACELPLILICELMGIPPEDRRKIFDWSNHLIGSDDPEMSEGIDPTGAATQMWLYSNELAAKKRAHPDDTLISKYVNGEVDGERITEFEFNNFFLLLSVAGNETTRNATSHFIRVMDQHPDQFALLRSDVDRWLEPAIEEVLRFSPPVMAFRRTALEDTEIRGVSIAKGDKLYLSYPSANRDEEVFERPEEFDITREKNDHIAFGIGEHYCLGANLARMQLRAILREVVTRLKELRVVEPPSIQRSNLIHGIKSMWVEYEPERA